ncbi:MAG: serine acetyltransferase [Oscillospiraceae bacterium]|jgi:serine O-acetyltransferase|nr:serine acetyltransferase [Oscillospiraceae bacterium]
MDKTGEIAVIKSIAEAVLSDRDKETAVLYPDKDVIREIINKLRYILFPEYFSSEHGSLPEYGVGAALEEVFHRLETQIAIVLKPTPEYKADSGIARGVTLEFLKKIPAIREYLLTDVEAAYEGDPAAYSKAEIIISYPGIFAVTVQRIARELYLLSVPLIPRMMTEQAHGVTGIDIHPGASIGKYFFIDHGTGIVIGETAVIGNHVKIYQGVTVGALSTRGGQLLKGVKRHPTIEDYVTIYSGASILGGSTVIGENTVIGGNAFVTKSVPEKTRVSVKNPELQFKTGESTVVKELEQDEFWYYTI